MNLAAQPKQVQAEVRQIHAMSNQLKAFSHLDGDLRSALQASLEEAKGQCYEKLPLALRAQKLQASILQQKDKMDKLNKKEEQLLKDLEQVREQKASREAALADLKATLQEVHAKMAEENDGKQSDVIEISGDEGEAPSASSSKTTRDLQQKVQNLEVLMTQMAENIEALAGQRKKHRGEKPDFQMAREHEEPS